MDKTGISIGLLTYMSEGNDNPDSMFFSRKIHHPSTASGVTIGRGYDMKHRTKQSIIHDLISAGVSPRQAEDISNAAHLSGAKAEGFVEKNRDLIGEISIKQQVSLFNNTYKLYISRAEARYKAKTAMITGACSWRNLNPIIRDVLIDIVYQGMEGTQIMTVSSSNNIDDLIYFLKNTPVYLQFERGRNRIGYLTSHR
ncbi:calcium-binding protein [Pantoea sp. App145]|uniref:calcium-binding protein n=1 Tax=Pantoea sp. App145 TaxID=3071567 RepID=UPI003A80862D